MIDKSATTLQEVNTPVAWQLVPPPKNGTYVVTSTIKGRKQEASLAYWDGDVWQHWSAFFDHAITHWMPTDLPEKTG
jgi:hypothetical protein